MTCWQSSCKRGRVDPIANFSPQPSVTAPLFSLLTGRSVGDDKTTKRKTDTRGQVASCTIVAIVTVTIATTTITVYHSVSFHYGAIAIILQVRLIE